MSLKELVVEKMASIIGVLIMAITGVIWNDLQDMKQYMNKQNVINERLVSSIEKNERDAQRNSTWIATMDKTIQLKEREMYEFKGRYLDMLEQERRHKLNRGMMFGTLPVEIKPEDENN